MKSKFTSWLAIALCVLIATPSQAGWMTRRVVGGTKKVLIYQGAKAVIPFAARTGVRAIGKVPKHIARRLGKAANDNYVVMPLPKRIFDKKTADHLIEKFQAGKTVKSANQRRNGFREALLKEKGPPPGPKMDADHTHPLILGGRDNAKTNGDWKAYRPNRAEGGYYGSFFKKNPVPFGTRIKPTKAD